ncbi:integrase core domain-containing protein, partial [Burkholderia cenocepacia]|uniref:integrase core domain-containing protein n=1 Tax=Burkholderia cenocepacia TaxID=95486 RepID=UPI00209AB94B
QTAVSGLAQHRKGLEDAAYHLAASSQSVRHSVRRAIHRRHQLRSFNRPQHTKFLTRPAAVEQRFGTTQAAQPIEWLTDNGSAYIDHRTRSFARELGLEPLTTPVRSPQSNGMAESFVKTMKHNYVAYMDKSDAPTALSRLAIAFEHYNERHPHKALKYRSPREFRRNAVSST